MGLIKQVGESHSILNCDPISSASSPWCKITCEGKIKAKMHQMNP